MKPIANIWHDKDGGVRAMVLANDNPLLDVKETPLFTEEQVKQNELEVRKNERELIVCKLRGRAELEINKANYYDELIRSEYFDLASDIHEDESVITSKITFSRELADQLERGGTLINE